MTVPPCKRSACIVIFVDCRQNFGHNRQWLKAIAKYWLLFSRNANEMKSSIADEAGAAALARARIWAWGDKRIDHHRGISRARRRLCCAASAPSEPLRSWPRWQAVQESCPFALGCSGRRRNLGKATEPGRRRGRRASLINIAVGSAAQAARGWKNVWRWPTRTRESSGLCRPRMCALTLITYLREANPWLAPSRACD